MKRPKKENKIKGVVNRLLQLLARFGPGATTFRVAFNRMRGAKIGKDAWIGYDCIFDTSSPFLIEIGDNVSISMRVTLIAHFKESEGIKIEDDVFIGPGAIILPNVTIGEGAVVTAGSVVAKSVPAGAMVQGNPATAILRCKTPLSEEVSLKSFTQGLRAA